jgi:phosphotransferase system enzyme I (PtsI)
VSVNSDAQEEIWLEGRAVVPGIAVGLSFTLPSPEKEIIHDLDISLPADSTELEIERFHSALSQSEKELQSLCEKLRLDGFSQEADLVETHLHMVNDPSLIKEVERSIREKGLRAESIVRSILERYRSHFELLPEALFRQRFEDVESVFLRILSFLVPEIQEKIEVPTKAIVFAHIVTAPAAAEVTMKDISAFVTTRGGAMSHTAIVAKARGIPYVTNIELKGVKGLLEGAKAIVDGLAGLVIINPYEETIRRYAALQNAHEKYVGVNGEEACGGETKDGCRVVLLANVADVQEAGQLPCYGLDGVGLYRTEYQVLELGKFPTEEEQTRSYAAMVQAANGRPVVIRTFDFGSDKAWKEASGILPEVECGSRPMELLLEHPDVFRAHLRSIVRACRCGPVSILFPMVSSVEELEQSLQLLHEAWSTVSEGWKNPRPKVGVMIELPSVAFHIKDFAGKIDFFSIGTNDLTQYSLAVDRSNSASFDTGLSFHPGLLHLMQYIVREMRSVNIPFCLCGEMASDPLLIPFLIGVGVRQLSIAPRLAPTVKHVLRSFTIEEAEQIADEVLSTDSAQEIYSFLGAQYRKIHFGG